jgi:hypothetical protein
VALEGPPLELQHGLAMAGIEYLLLTVVTADVAGNLGGAIQDAHGGIGGPQGQAASG